MWGFFILTMAGVLASIVVLLRRYCAKSVSWEVQVATAFGWLTAMTIVAIVPLDTYATLNHRNTDAVAMMWSIVFWSTQVMSWIFLPFFQFYSAAGNFTIAGRCLYSLKENAVFYAIMGVVSIIGVGALIITNSMSLETMMGVGAGISNAFGLFCGILLLGYGLVEIPRFLWRSDPELLLKLSAHRAGAYAEAVMKSTAELEAVVMIIFANMKQMRRHDPLRKYMDIIGTYAEAESPVKPSQMEARNVDIEALKAEDLEYNYDLQGLAELRRRMFYAIAVYKGARAQYDACMLGAFELESIVKCRQLHLYNPPVENPSALVKAHWYYKCVCRPSVQKVAAVLLGLTSLMIIWSEATIAASLNMSPLSLAVQYFAVSEALIQLIVLLPLAYICACSYTAVFAISISSSAFDYNKLIPGATIGAALMQNGCLMCRFAAPTCWNFYHIIRMTSTEPGEETVFTKQISNMDMPAILATHLNTYLPLVLVLTCSITAFNAWERLVGCCGGKYKLGTDDVDDVFTEKGRLLIQKEHEASAKGFRIGEVLHSAYFDLEFPELQIGPRSKTKSKKTGFFGLFGRKDAEGSSAEGKVSGPSSSLSGPSKQASAATLQASRWTGKGGGSGASGAGSLVPPAHEKPTSSLLASRYDKSPTGSQTEASTGGGGGKSGLDGIFADLRPTAPGGASHSSGPGPSSTSGLVIGPPGAKKSGGDRETDRLLGGGIGSFKALRSWSASTLLPAALHAQALEVDFVIFLGDFGNENIEVVRQISTLQQPFAAILGNHDAWYSMGSRQRNGRAMQQLAAANAQAAGSSGAQQRVSQPGPQPLPEAVHHQEQQQQQQQQQPQQQPPLRDGVSLQISLLGSSHIGYGSMRVAGKDLAIVGARPFSKGGSSFSSIAGFMQRLYGIGDMEQSAAKVVQVATQAAARPPVSTGTSTGSSSASSTSSTSTSSSGSSQDGTHSSSQSSDGHNSRGSGSTPGGSSRSDPHSVVAGDHRENPISLIMVSHCGPSGLGEQAYDCVGVDWTLRGGDHGDPDLQSALSTLHSTGVHVPLVLFGHMHHRLHKSSNLRRMVAVHPTTNTVYLNAATVPRIRPSPNSPPPPVGSTAPRLQHHHFLVAEIEEGEVMRASDVWVEVAEAGYRSPVSHQQTLQAIEQARVDAIEAERVARALAYELSRPKAPANISPRQRRDWHRREQQARAESQTAMHLSSQADLGLRGSAVRASDDGGSDGRDTCGSVSTSDSGSEPGGDSSDGDKGGGEGLSQLRVRIVEESCVLRSTVGEGGTVRFAWDAFDQQWRPVVMHVAV
ncbi:MAG: hypothetical protein WDW36_000821 [Sanguina aurantia]